jgi:acyl-homoserine lactone acylase PvdQ
MPIFFRLSVLLVILSLSAFSQNFTEGEITAWEKRAQAVSIIRDKWGVPHIYGKTDADAVFGLMYAQCEDNFAEIEMNYLKYLGRLAEARGASELNNDLRIRLVVDAEQAKEEYKSLEPYMRDLLIAFADGINYYIHKNSINPVVLKRFDPWFPLVWTHGSIDHINTAGISSGEIRDFYLGRKDLGKTDFSTQDLSRGSNAIAVGPSKSVTGNALLYINPHVTLHARTEAHMISEEGLNVYGAMAWGQFFVYQGFNESCGWMHTSSMADAADLYLEKITTAGDKMTYLYDGKQKPVIKKEIKLRFSTNGDMKLIKVTGLYTGHGPVLAKSGDRYISLRASNRSLRSLLQNWERGKVKNFEDFKKNMSYCSEATDNTTYADNQGNIAHWHGNFIPVRNKKYNWDNPVDGTTSSTEWKGFHKPEETVYYENPENGWIQNCNSSPFYGSDESSPKREKYPSYMAPDGENFRSLNAARLLKQDKKFSLSSLIEIGYDKTLTAFEILIPALKKAFEDYKTIDPEKYGELQGVIDLLSGWDYKVDEKSAATGVAVEWAERLKMSKRGGYNVDQISRTLTFVSAAKPDDLLEPLKQLIEERLQKYVGWDIEWGSINTYQRINYAAGEVHSDLLTYYPVPWASATWGMLPSFDSRYINNSGIRFGIHGNSFVCAVEFGKKIKARSLLAGGSSAEAGTVHYDDQVEMYRTGTFKDVFFYKKDVLGNSEKSYHPGE